MTDNGHEWTCPKCPCSGVSPFYRTFDDIIKHKYKVFARKRSMGFILQIEVGDRNGTPLFTLKGLNDYTQYGFLNDGEMFSVLRQCLIISLKLEKKECSRID